ncbi:hypothetical protein B0H21DRAFT_753240 [Amylocystis lapponica]|nr:hypothetical protein B0H21DRAFT_753240 [Amylocystis lapponica]
MSTGGMSLPTIAERLDIHKSCKTLEVVVNILNDYCEAVNAIVLLQKKLAKALKEAAVVKCIGEVPANALNTTATIFEALSEVDSKFGKIADKECDSVSAEVKKWFKKLAKEERAHDDKIATANAKIKQAGQVYEKKAKKNPQDVGEEHTRYMNLLGTLGPEINQEKYNHGLKVTQRHSAIVYSLAACLSRVADSEWMRSCEGVRRFSPTVGQLGEWRALCEGGWSGRSPIDLPDLDTEPPAQDVRTNVETVEQVSQALTVPTSVDRPVPEYSSRHASEQEQGASSRALTPSGNSPVAPPQYIPLSGEQRVDSKSPQVTQKTSNASLTSLTSFPSPPTRVPLPPAPPPADSGKKSVQDAARVVPRPLPTPGPITTPPLTEGSMSPPTPRTELFTPLTASPIMLSAEVVAQEKPLDQVSRPTSIDVAHSTPSSSGRISTSGRRASGSYTKEEHIDDAEFGVRRSMEARQSSRPSHSDGSSGKNLERSDTTKSNRSSVAALRDRYARPAEPTSPTKKEVPRMPTSVSSLANKYERPGAVSPGEGRRRTSLDSIVRQSIPERSNGPIAKYTTAAPTDELAIRRQRIEELEELELREQEYELRIREREIEQKAREVERERLRLLSARGADGYASDSSRGTANRTLQRPPATTSQSRYPLYSYSTTHLVPPSSAPSSSGQPASQPSSPIYRPTDHAPFCGCDTCSASKYKKQDVSPSPRDLRPPETPITLRPEKPKGWIRRLSLPVMGNAFSSDSKKSSAGIAGGPGFRSSLVSLQEDGQQGDLGTGYKNRSSTNLPRR